MSVSAKTFYSQTPDAQMAALQQLAQAALAHWPGTFTGLKPVKYRENAVFSAIRDDGRRFAVRIHRHGYHSYDALRSELTWMKALADTGISAPPVAPCLSGSALLQLAHPAVPEARHIDLLEWLPGAPIGSAEEGLSVKGIAAATLFEQVGALAARVHNHSSGWVDAGTIVRHTWDEEGLIGAEPFWGRFWEIPGLTDAQGALLRKACDRATVDLTAFGKGGDRFGLIHADFVPENLLFDGEKLSLIDFDDCCFGWHMFELATALFFTLDQSDHEDLKAALLRGYRRARALPPEQEASLPLFMFLRGTTYLGWIQTRPETETAQEMGPMMIERTSLLAERYLAAHGR